MRFDPRELLKHAAFYSTLQKIGARCRATYVERHLKLVSGAKVLDVGCGPGDLLAFLPNVEYFGFDCEERYIKAAKARYGDRGNFNCSFVSSTSISDPGTYDLVNASGVLHHLSDKEAEDLFLLARAALKPSGKLVTLDNCFVAGQSVISKALAKLDRGKFVRSPEEYRRLALKHFDNVELNVSHDLLKPIPYSHVIMECRVS